MKLLITLLLLIWLAPVHARDFPLGRLFMPPEKRQELDIFRLQGTDPVTEQAKEKPAAPNFIQFNGLVIRSDGQRTAWINGKQQAPAGIHIDLEHLDNNRLPVYIINGGSTILIKPGQRLDTVSGQLREGFDSTP